MHMMLVGGSGDAKRVEANYTLRVSASGGSVGVLAANITSVCHSTMLTTSNGTLLMANGYDTMYRMRQDEKTLSPAGVPAPKTPLRIMTADEISGDADSQVTQDILRTYYFDFTEYGLHAGIRVSGDIPADLLSLLNPPSYDIRYTPLGQNAFTKRHADYLTLLRQIRADEEAVNEYGNVLSATALRNMFLLPYRTAGDGLAWRNTTITIGIRNINNVENTDIFTTYSGRYQAFVRFVDKNGIPSDPSPISTDTLLVNAPYVFYRDVEKPTDPNITRRQVFRNIDGSSDAFYLDIDTTDLTSSTLVSYNTDAQLKLKFGQAVWDDNGYNLFYLYGRPPSDKPYIAEYNSVIFAAGKREYREGVVSVVNGSTSVQGVGTSWTPAFIGMKITLGNAQYPVIDCVKATQIITLGKAYEGPTNPYLKYSIEPYYANGNLMTWSTPGFPESWPIRNQLQLPEDGDDITGLVVFDNSMWILKSRSVYQFSYTSNPGIDGDYKPASSRGCINQRCAVQVQNVCLMLDRVGVHVFKGSLPRVQYQTNTTPDHLSLPIGDMFRFEGTWLRINWDADKCWWHGVHCQEMKTVRWYVTMQGFDLPQHAICYDYLMDRWWVEEYPFPITSSCQGTQLIGRPLLGGPNGQVLQPDLGPLDMVDAPGTRIAVDEAYSPVTLLLQETPPECVGTSIAIVAGRGRGQCRKVLSQAGNVVEVDNPFLVLPDSDSIVQVGAIPYYLKSPEVMKLKIETSKPHAFGFQFEATSVDLEAYVTITQDGTKVRRVAAGADWGAVTSVPDDPTVYKVDLSNESEAGIINMDSWRERDWPRKYTIQADIQGYSGEEKPRITQMSILGASTTQDLTT